MAETHAGTGSMRASAEFRLRQHWFALVKRRRLILAVFGVVMCIALARVLFARPIYRGSAQLLIERETPSVLAFKEVAELNERGWGDDYYQTQYKLLQSRVLARRVIEELKLLDDPRFSGNTPTGLDTAFLTERAISRFLAGLTVQWQRNSRLVTVSYESPNRELAARIANAVAEGYMRLSLDFRTNTSSEAADWLGRQIQDQQTKVQDADEALQRLKEREGIVNIEERRTLVEQKLKELGSALTVLRTQRLEKEGLIQEMKATRDPEELPEVMRSPVVQALRIELATLERQQAQLQDRFLDQHPEVVKVRNQIQETRRKIALEAQRVVRAADNDFRTASAQEKKLAADIEAAKAEALDLSRRGVRYDAAKREVDAAKEVLTSLVARHQQTDVVQQLRASNIHLVDRAVVPERPVRPQRVLGVLGGALIGVLLGCGLAFVLEHLDSTLKTPDDVRRLGAPLLAVVPEMPREGAAASRILVGHAPPGPFVEGYRLLRTQLNYCWPSQGPRVIAVTSTAPGEGKTLTSVNLALTLAARDGRVLLVDGDLRKPQVHALLRVRRSPGLSELLVGQKRASETIQEVPGSVLSLLTAGSQVPSPADLLSVAALGGLIESVRGLYSWIVIDTPPVGAVADALIFSPLADGVIVVAGAEMVPFNAALHTLERVTETGARILGVVLNRAHVERQPYAYGYHYGHYYKSYVQETSPVEAAAGPRAVAR